MSFFEERPKRSKIRNYVLLVILGLIIIAYILFEIKATLEVKNKTLVPPLETEMIDFIDENGDYTYKYTYYRLTGGGQEYYREVPAGGNKAAVQKALKLRLVWPDEKKENKETFRFRNATRFTGNDAVWISPMADCELTFADDRLKSICFILNELPEKELSHEIITGQFKEEVHFIGKGFRIYSDYLYQCLTSRYDDPDETEGTQYRWTSKSSTMTLDCGEDSLILRFDYLS